MQKMDNNSIKVELERLSCLVCLNSFDRCDNNDFKENGVTVSSPFNEDLEEGGCRTVRKQLDVIFLLRKLLEIPEDVCIQLLENYGNPSSWIGCCETCSNLINKARLVFNQIDLLQKLFSKLQSKIKREINLSTKVKTLSSSDDIENGVNKVIRSHVTNGVIKKEDVTADNTNSEPVGYTSSSSSGESESDDSLLKNKTKKKYQYQERNEKYSCKICSETFSTYSLFRHHLKSHMVEKCFSCQTCNKGFQTPYRLKRHELIHTDKKPYKCKLCGKGFNTSYALANHMKTHPGEKTHQCEICSKYFDGVSKLNVHMKSHDKEGRYKCGVCAKRFDLSTRLALHMKTHIGETRVCEICKKYFSTAGALKKHSLIHA